MRLPQDPGIWIKELLVGSGFSSGVSSFLSTAGLVVIVLLLSWLANLLAKAIINTVVIKIVRRTRSVWDDIFVDQKVFTRLSHLAPALVIWFMAGWALKDHPVWLQTVQKLTYIYMVLTAMVVVNSFIEAWHKIYLTLPISQHRHIKGYVQLLKIVVITITILIITGVIFMKEVSAIIAGLGAMAAVLMLIFKDPILGLVGSIQLSANKMMKIGDWITIPGRNVDGVVTDITLTTVKVQNFDKTIITVPTYSLVSEPFQNWIGMEESGVRQIKRAIFIDMQSINFPDESLLKRINNMELIREYMESRKMGYENSGNKSGTGPAAFNSPLITNLGYFRIYSEAYLRKHPLIDKSQTLIVRHLQPAGNGLPIQVYAFSSNRLLVPYENLQAEIFEHLIAVLPQFGLKVFQLPSENDYRTFINTD